MPNGDIVSGCSDGVVRVFSESEDRWASAEDLKAYDDQVAGQALASQTIGDVKQSDISGSESLATPGSFLSNQRELIMITMPPFQVTKPVKPSWCEKVTLSRLIR